MRITIFFLFLTITFILNTKLVSQVYQDLEASSKCFFPSNGPFITNNFCGQLGNQLYQMATGISLAIDNHCRYIIPINVRNQCIPIFWRMPFQEIIKPENVFQQVINGYDETNNFIPIKYKENIKLYGYFLSYKYFDHNKNAIIQLFRPSETIIKYILSKYGEILKHPITVGLHIRTFYPDILIVKKSTGTIKSACNLFYKSLPPPNKRFIEQAIEYFPENSLFIVCSDNIQWSKKFLKSIPRQFIFIENEEYWIDFYLLTLCHNIIISNSSFSWWAAYLNENKNKTVIAPYPYAYDNKRKLEDTYPSEWKIINRQEDHLVPNFDEGELFFTLP